MTASSHHGGKRIGAGRPPKSIEDRKLFAGKIRIHVAPESALLAQRMMLHFPDVPSVEKLYEYAMVRLSQTTDD